MKRKVLGFTLVELMIVVVVVSILAAVAVPSYRNYVRRSDRADAKVALLQNAQFLERNFTMSNRYDQDSAGVPIADDTLLVTQSPTNAAAKYTMSVAPDISTYILTATPVAGGPMDGDPCGSFTINQAGVKGLEDNTETVATCWNK